MRRADELSGLLEPKREEQLIAAALLARLNAAKDALEQDEESAKSEVRKLEAQLTEIASDLIHERDVVCLLYTSPSPRDLSTSRMPSSA